MKQKLAKKPRGNECDISFIPSHWDAGFTNALLCPYCGDRLGMQILRMDPTPIDCPYCKKKIIINRVPTICQWQIRREKEKK